MTFDLLYFLWLQVREQHIHYQSKRCVINDEKNCAVCKKRIGNSAFARYPNGVIVHYYCCKDPLVCPVEPTWHHKTLNCIANKIVRTFWCLTLKVPEKLQLYGHYVYYVVHICDFGILRVNRKMDSKKSMISYRKYLLSYILDFITIPLLVGFHVYVMHCSEIEPTPP